MQMNREIPSALVEHKSEIQSLANDNATAREMLQWLAVRERNHDCIELPRFKTQLQVRGVKVVDDEYINAFKELQKLGIGALVFGRKGNADRFEFHYTMRDIGTLSISDPSVLAPKIEKINEEKKHRKGYLNKLVKVKRTVVKRPGRSKAKFNRSQFMKEFWAKRRKPNAASVIKSAVSNNVKVIELLQQVIKELKTA